MKRFFASAAIVVVGVVAQNGPGGTCGLEFCGATCAPVQHPTFANLPNIAELPDPFTRATATGRISQKSEWNCRRAELYSQFQQWELGTKPTKPSVVTGTVSRTQIAVTAGDGTTSISFTATVQVPTTGTAPYPALIGIGGISLNSNAIRNMGVALINFNNNDIAAQNNAQSRGQGKFYTLYGANHNASAMTAWAWGVSRILDVIEASDGTVIDIKRIGTTGCSRNGKGALVVGAFDERIALAIPQESGSGGTATWRISDFQGTTVQTLGEITGENVWFMSSLTQFNGPGQGLLGTATTKLPVDHHELLGLMAPRAVLVIENTGQVWLGNQSCWGSCNAGHKIYEALGIPDRMGCSQIGGHNHCAFPASQEATVEAFISKFLIGGGTASTAVMVTDLPTPYNNAMWSPWTVPTLT